MLSTQDSTWHTHEGPEMQMEGRTPDLRRIFVEH